MQKIESLKDTFGEEKFKEIQKKSDKNVEDIAEVLVRTAANKKPESLKRFERETRSQLKEVGIVDNAIKKEIMTKIQKTEFFRQLTDNFVSDQDLLDVYKDALSAEKITMVDKDPVYTPDHTTRLSAADKLARYKGIDTKAEGDSQGGGDVKIVMFNPLA